MAVYSGCLDMETVTFIYVVVYAPEFDTRHLKLEKNKAMEMS